MTATAAPTPARPTLAARLGVDRAVALTLLGRGWSIGAAPLTLVLTTTCLSAVEQGYYYTFNAVLGLVVFLELGLAVVLSQFASHEMARLTWVPPAAPTGDPVALRRLASLLQLGTGWYAAAAAVAVAGLVPAGLWFFAGRESSESVSWRLPWVLMTAVAGLTLAVSPVLAVLEGCGFVARMAGLRLAQTVAATLAFWAALAGGAGLLAMPVMAAAGLAVCLAGLAARWAPAVRFLLATPTGPDRVRYTAEVLPLHARIGLSWLSGYLSLLCTPILFAALGPEWAGRYGLTTSLCVTAGVTAQAWLSTRAPEMGRLIAAGEFGRLHAVFYAAAGRSLVVFAAAAVVALAGTVALSQAGSRYADRLLPPADLAVLLLSFAFWHGTGLLAIYLRAYKQDVLCGQSIAGGMALVAGTYWLVPRFGLPAALWLQVAVNAACLGGAVLWFRAKLRAVPA